MAADAEFHKEIVRRFDAFGGKNAGDVERKHTVCFIALAKVGKIYNAVARQRVAVTRIPIAGSILRVAVKITRIAGLRLWVTGERT